MKRVLKTKIIKKIASILTATMIFSSGGLTTITNIFGLSKNNKNQINKEISHTKIISNYESSNKTINLEQSKYKYKYKPSENDKSIIKFVTTEAITQEENIDRLIRKRRKETKEKLTFNNK